MFLRPGNLLGIRKATTVAPAHLGIYAATAAVHAGKLLARVLDKGNGQGDADRRDSHRDSGEHTREFEQEIGNQRMGGQFHG